MNLSDAGQYSGVNTSTLTVTNVTPSNNNQLFRCVIGEGYCSDTTRTALLVIDNNASVNQLNESSFSIFPNPSEGQFIVNVPEYFQSDLYLIQDLRGAIVKTGTLTKQMNTIITTELSKGIYVFKLENSNQSELIILE